MEYYGPIGALVDETHLSWDLTIPVMKTMTFNLEGNAEDEDPIDNNDAAESLENERTEHVQQASEHTLNTASDSV
ncbi:hypothetical protein EW145_g4628 [Phellinidium pouzarii]|uniref:Uncharacterized protein n=1 Tax=Phellinidium pouzarii TaxID=167371 RepID=A0A4S4L303_9AGAM|nr:hypothetical protein EW145_g4628 [Phellinidium pouzarii]